MTGVGYDPYSNTYSQHSYFNMLMQPITLIKEARR